MSPISHSQPPTATILLYLGEFNLFRFHIYGGDHAIFIFHFLTYLTCLQGPSTLLQMAGFLSFCDWIIFHCVYIPHLFFLTTWIDTLTLFPYLCCCEWCCSKYGGANISSISCFHFPGLGTQILHVRPREKKYRKVWERKQNSFPIPAPFVVPVFNEMHISLV